MNSDLHETAAWRAFGMLDADEAGAFDEAVRLDPELKKVVEELNELTAAVAVVSVSPVTPRPGEIDRLRARLGFPVHRHFHWIAWSGWAAAALLALLLVIQKQPGGSRSAVAVHSGKMEVAPPVVTTRASIPTEVVVETPAIPPAEPPMVAGNEVGPVRVETKRLIQEIEVLRGQLANFQKRDRERFSPVPGVAWPIVMTMRPPGFSLEGDPAAISLSTVLGDALAGRESFFGGKLSPPETDPLVGTDPSIVDSTLVPETVTPIPTAIPIYDSARDAGTLVVGNLPPLEANDAYNLWVRTNDAANPVYVGRLPETVAAGADALDFSLGSTGIVPSGFILTRDADGPPTTPVSGNTILQGP